MLAARLSDARFFWEQDKKIPLAEQAKKLARITFHEKLGTVADKVARVAALAEGLAREGVVPNCDPAQARQAAELCKADLVTEMVGEFPELQGLMGGYYAREEDLPQAVADAIRDHYKPVGQGDDVPTAPVTVAVALADKLDTLRSFFGIDEKPTGSRDPFALRRAALGVIQIVTENTLRFPVAEGDLLDFFADRLKVQQKEAGVRHDLIDAVFALGQENGGGEDDLVRLLARVKALQAFVTTEDGANLLAGSKRAANILKTESGDKGGAAIANQSQTGEEDPGAGLDDPDVAEAIRAHEAAFAPSSALEPAEAALIAALDAAEPRADAAISAEDFGGAMAALATLRAPIDAFFDSVIVNSDEPEKRAGRLALLQRISDAAHKVADFSRIAG